MTCGGSPRFSKNTSSFTSGCTSGLASMVSLEGSVMWAGSVGELDAGSEDWFSGTAAADIVSAAVESIDELDIGVSVRQVKRCNSRGVSARKVRPARNRRTQLGALAR